MTTRSLHDALTRTVVLCDQGYRLADPEIYGVISQTLREHADADGVAALVRLSDGGPTLTSKRFAFPHIQERAAELLKTLHASASVAGQTMASGPLLEATEAEIAAACDAAVGVLEAGGFTMQDGVAWAEPGDLHVAGLDVKALVAAALRAANAVRGGAAS